MTLLQVGMIDLPQEILSSSELKNRLVAVAWIELAETADRGRHFVGCVGFKYGGAPLTLGYQKVC